MMKHEEYEAAMTQLGVMAGLAADIDTAALQNHITTAETLAPILEPTAYIRGGANNLEDQQELLNAFTSFANKSRKLKERLAKERRQGQ